MSPAEKQIYLERMVAEIGEHFDAVQILAHDSDSTSYTEFEAGTGSLFARMYQAERFTREPETVETEEEEEDDESEQIGD